MRVIAIVLLMSFAILFCGKDITDISVPVRISQAPLYLNMVELNLAHKIEMLGGEYNIPYIQDYEIDEDGNVYVMSRASEIAVFDPEGNYIQSIGQPGDGPEDIRSPYYLAYGNRKLYIYEKPFDIKILTKQGKYVGKIFGIPGNLTFFDVYGDNYCAVLFYHDFSQTWRYTINLYSETFEKIRQIKEYIVDKDQEFHFNPRYSTVIDSRGNIVIPNSSSEFLLNKYDPDGNLLFQFGREYKRQKYSEDARKVFDKYASDPVTIQMNFGKKMQMAEYPPVIRHIFADQDDNFWVMSGEIHGDVDRVKEVIVDIFSNDGGWLYTLQTKNVNLRSKIVNGRLYTATKIISIDAQQYIKVFDITYDH
ncbi:hypothetical protein ACFL67_01900 [candidate division KSB1 bacterium]